MTAHPARLLVFFPMWEAKDYRRRLVAIDDALVVHHVADDFQLELRPIEKLRTRGPHSYAAALIRLAADLKAGYRVMIVDRDVFLADLAQLARVHMARADRDAVEHAAQVVAERARYQIDDHLRPADAESLFGRVILATRERRTKIRKGEQPGINMQCGVPTPRSEQLWHSLRYEWCSPRDQQAGMAAWQRWCRRNRPAMPRGDTS